MAGVLRAVSDLPEPDRSVLRLRYDINNRTLDDESLAERVGMSVREFWEAEAVALEAVGFALVTEASLFELLEALS